MCVAVWARQRFRAAGSYVGSSRWLTWPITLALLPGALWGTVQAVGNYFTDTPVASRAVAYLLAGAAVPALGAAGRVGGVALAGGQVTAVAAVGVVIAIATSCPAGSSSAWPASSSSGRRPAGSPLPAGPARRRLAGGHALTPGGQGAGAGGSAHTPGFPGLHHAPPDCCPRLTTSGRRL